ncbi:MAG: DedA family protein [Alphaproteobacteria bacterium]|nr:DedA family protein [Alphaproteobacteria bacterium]
MEHFAHHLIDLIKAHPDLAVLIIGGTAFGESFAFLSLLFPGTTILIAAGALVRTGAIDPVSAAVAGAVGAIVGDAISFWIGRKFEPVIARAWPFSRHPESLQSGFAFFKRFGWASVFIGRFFGPLRAIVPLVAGMMEMPLLPFYTANVLSAVIWAPALVLSGYLVSSTLLSGLSIEDKLLIAVLAGAVVAAIIVVARRAARVR